MQKLRIPIDLTCLCGHIFFFGQNEGFLQNQEPSFLTERAINMNEEETHIKV